MTDLDDPNLSADDHHHLARVRRVHDGDPIVIGDGAGGWRRAVMHAHRPDPTTAITVVVRPEPALALAFALVKGAKPELVVQKLTELGIDDIRPFTAARSVVRWDESRAVGAQARLAKVARGAAMQSRRAWLPTVHPVATFASVASLPGACRADRGGEPATLAQPLILVGPEGGWSDEERNVALASVGLGPHVLRAETAAIAAATVLGALRAGLVATAESVEWRGDGSEGG
ncbi:MAG: RsmE family RNA methyltransferase [Acidimicrobiales bacterium]